MFPLNIKTIHETFAGEFKSLNSKFIAYVFPFHQKEVLQGILGQLKKEHPKASHWCYAYRVGYQNEEFRANDDGEPSGSAGKPILNQLYSHEVKNALIVVVRYFGGTKLGVPGLIEAYKEAANDALKNANFVFEDEIFEMKYFVSMTKYYQIMPFIKKHQITILSESIIGNEINLTIKGNKEALDGLKMLIESF
jgi:uncharacterized YigZ family protein